MSNQKQSGKKVRLNQLLTPEQIQHVVGLMNRHPDDAALIRELKNYLRTLTVQLEAKEVVPDYLAYCLLYARTQLGLPQ